MWQLLRFYGQRIREVNQRDLLGLLRVGKSPEEYVQLPEKRYFSVAFEKRASLAFWLWGSYLISSCLVSSSVIWAYLKGWTQALSELHHIHSPGRSIHCCDLQDISVALTSFTVPGSARMLGVPYLWATESENQWHVVQNSFLWAMKEKGVSQSSLEELPSRHPHPRIPKTREPMKDAQTATFAFLTLHMPFQYASHIKSQDWREQTVKKLGGNPLVY